MSNLHTNLHLLSQQFPAFFSENDAVETLAFETPVKPVTQDEPTFLQQVEARILELMPHGTPKAEQVARTFNMSIRTLHRRLSQVQMSYRDVLFGVRKTSAAHLLRDTALPLKQVAMKLGFSESCNFSRSFKQWYDMTPQDYRTQYLAA